MLEHDPRIALVIIKINPLDPNKSSLEGQEFMDYSAKLGARASRLSKGIDDSRDKIQGRYKIAG